MDDEKKILREILADGGVVRNFHRLSMVYLLRLWMSAVNHVYELKIVLEIKP